MSSKEPWETIEKISVKELYEAPGNPQEQTATTFAALVEDIEKDGFDQPINVVPREAGGYTVVDGNHRLRALNYLKYEEVPCIVRKDWDEATAKIKLIRRNMLSGSLDSKKFTKYIDEFSDRFKIDKEALPDLMGFDNKEEFLAIYQGNDLTEDDLEKLGGGKLELKIMDNLSDFLNKIFTEYGDAVPYNFVPFFYGRKLHTLIQANPAMRKCIEDVSKKCFDEKKDINEVLPDLIRKGLALDSGEVEEDVPFEFETELEKEHRAKYDF